MQAVNSFEYLRSSSSNINGRTCISQWSATKTGCGNFWHSLWLRTLGMTRGIRRTPSCHKDTASVLPVYLFSPIKTWQFRSIKLTMKSFITLQCIMECNKYELEKLFTVFRHLPHIIKGQVSCCACGAQMCTGTKFNASTSGTKVPPQNPHINCHIPSEFVDSELLRQSLVQEVMVWGVVRDGEWGSDGGRTYLVSSSGWFMQKLEVINSIQAPATYHKWSSVVLCMWGSNVHGH